jgi:AcrR family transcriptional regulator
MTHYDTTKYDATKRAFAQALRQLTQEQLFEKITVSQICAQAGFSRKAFYSHFFDKTSLVNWLCYTEFFENHPKLMADGGWKAAQAMAYYFEKDRQLYGHALLDTSPNSFGSYFLAVLEVVIMNTTRPTMEHLTNDEKVMSFMVETVSETLRRLLAEYLLDPTKSVDELFLMMRKGAEIFAAIVCSVPLRHCGKGPCTSVEYPLRFDRARAGERLRETLMEFNCA